jgi:hypothetical protein
MTRGERRFVFGLLAIIIAFLGWRWLVAAGQAGENIRKLEAAELRAAGYQTAIDASRRELNKALGQSETLQAEVDRLTEVAKAKPRSVTKWRTNPINIDMREELRRAYESMNRNHRTIEVPIEVPAECADVEWPPFMAEVAGTTVELVTEGGNTVVLGEVELVGGFEGVEPRLLGRSPWRHDLTDTVKQREKRPLRNALAVGVHSGVGLDVRFTRLITARRLAAWVGVQYDHDPFAVQLDNFSAVADRTRVAGGLEWRF